jgi:membrane protein
LKIRLFISEVLKKIIVLYRFVTAQTRKIKLPFFQGLSIYDVTTFFFKGIYEGAVTMRAASASFSLFLALFPGIIFIFTLIPYIPIDGFQDRIFIAIRDVLPRNSYEAAKETIDDILNTKRGNLLSVTFFVTLFFATNGVLSLLSSFSYSFHKINLKNFWQQYVSAVFLTVVLTIFSIALLTIGEKFFEWLAEHGHLQYGNIFLLKIIRTLILLMTIQVSISMLYNFGSVKRGHWKFFSPGSILATILIIISSLIFGYYVDNFSQYNKLYGSIGTLMVIMLWIYINIIGLIIGFELNASIAGAKRHETERAKNIDGKRF